MFEALLDTCTPLAAGIDEVHLEPVIRMRFPDSHPLSLFWDQVRDDDDYDGSADTIRTQIETTTLVMTARLGFIGCAEEFRNLYYEVFSTLQHKPKRGISQAMRMWLSSNTGKELHAWVSYESSVLVRVDKLCVDLA